MADLAIITVFALLPVTLLGERFPGAGYEYRVDTAWLAWLVAAIASIGVLRSNRATVLPNVWALLGLGVLGSLGLLWTSSLFNGVMVLGAILALPLVYASAAASQAGTTAFRIRGMAMVWLPVLGIGFLLLGGPPAVGAPLFPALSVTDGIQFSNRLLGIALVSLFIIATIGKPTRTRLLVVGGVTLALAVGSGSRTASFVIALLILTSPALRIGWRTRVGWVVVAAVFVSSALTIPAIRERWFVDDQGSVVDILTLSSNLDTTGRRELWSSLVTTCNKTWLVGLGMGASNQLSEEYSDGRIRQPHNEYLRIYCDSGLIGSAMFWSALIAIGLRASRTLRQNRDAVFSVSALQFLAAFFLLSITDNVLAASVQFTLPAFIVFGWSDQLYVRPRNGFSAIIDGPQLRLKHDR